MKIALLIVGYVVLITACAQQQTHMTQPGIVDSTLGLSKTSVFDVPTPPTFSYSQASPGSSKVLPRAYPGAPPQIPHNINGFKPITAKNNACLGCHNNPAMRGKKIAGMPTPIPESHYVDQRFKPGVVGKTLVEARYVCTQCHVPQAKVAPLVDNTFQNEVQAK